MVEYVIDGAVFVAYERAPRGRDSVRSYDDLARLGEQWDGKTLVALYNNVAGEAVRKFTNHETGIKRLWKALQDLPVTPPARGKKGMVIAMIQGPSGATLEEIMNATGWQAHSVRGFLSTQRKDYTIQRREREADITAYYASKKPER